MSGMNELELEYQHTKARESFIVSVEQLNVWLDFINKTPLSKAFWEDVEVNVNLFTDVEHPIGSLGQTEQEMRISVAVIVTQAYAAVLRAFLRHGVSKSFIQTSLNLVPRSVVQLLPWTLVRLSGVTPPAQESFVLSEHFYSTRLQ